MAIVTNSTILNILINGDASGAIRALDQAGNAAQSAGDKMASVGGRLTAGVTVPLAGLAAASVGAAADLEAAASKVDQVFGDASGGVEEFATTTTDAFGISERAALQAAGTFGNLFTAMDVSQGSAAEMSVRLIELTGDLAAFHDIAREDVLGKLQSGLVGEIEPLRALGVSFDAAAVNAEAMAVAVAAGRDVVTDADKVVARYNLILEGTATAQGQAAREADSLSSQQARATAELENSAAALGQRLLPAAADATKMVADLAGMFADLPAPVQDTVVKVGVFVAALGPALFIGGKVTKAVTDLGTAFRRLGVGGTAATAGAAVGLALVATALYQAEQRAEAARRRMDELADAMADGFSGSVLEENLEQWAVQLDGLGLTVSEVGNALAGGEDSWTKFVENFQRGFSDVDQRLAALGQLNLIVGGYSEQIQAAAVQEEVLSRFMDRATSIMEAKGEAILRAHDVTKGYQGIVEDTYESVRDLTRETDRYIGTLDELYGMTTNVAAAQRDVFDAVEQARTAIDGVDDVLDPATEAGRRNVETIEQVAGAYLGYAQALADSKAPQSEINDALAHGRQTVSDLLAEYGVAPEYIGAYVDALGLIPRDIDTNVALTYPSVSFAESIGKDIAAGVARGMDAGKDDVDQAAQRLVGNANRAAKLAAGINSPSTLFANEVGKPISEGTAQGILDALDAPASAMDQLFDELVDRANTGVGNVLGGIGSVFGTGNAQDRVSKAQADLDAARSAYDRTPQSIARAERDLAEAQLALVSASQSMVEAGQELLGQGPEGAEKFRQLGRMAGLSDSAIEGLLAQLSNATSWAGQFLPGDVGHLFGQPAASATVAEVHVHMPPGSDGDDVVAALTKWERTNGPIPVKVRG